MEFIAHRVNRISELLDLPSSYGVELDLRDDLSGKVYIQHHPFERGEDFENYLRQYHHGTMILNVKSERIEATILKLLKKYYVKDYFFLDSSFPMIYLLSKQGENNIALRLSEYEGMDTIRNMAGKVKWVWIDCFTKIPVGRKEMNELKELGYRTCFVSPELQGRDEEVDNYIKYLRENEITFDAVCTKKWNIDKWRELC